jgi:hypothetical protein
LEKVVPGLTDWARVISAGERTNDKRNAGRILPQGARWNGRPEFTIRYRMAGVFKVINRVKRHLYFCRFIVCFLLNR